MIQPPKSHGFDNFVERAMEVWKVPGAAALLERFAVACTDLFFVAAATKKMGTQKNWVMTSLTVGLWPRSVH